DDHDVTARIARLKIDAGCPCVSTSRRGRTATAAYPAGADPAGALTRADALEATCPSRKRLRACLFSPRMGIVVLVEAIGTAICAFAMGPTIEPGPSGTPPSTKALM